MFTIILLFFKLITVQSNLFYNIYAELEQEYNSIVVNSNIHTTILKNTCKIAEQNCSSCRCISVSVTHQPPEKIIGCKMILEYYIAQEKHITQNNKKIDNLVANQYSETISSTYTHRMQLTQSLIIDTKNVKHFCNTLGAEMYIQRSLWQQYIKASSKYHKV